LMNLSAINLREAQERPEGMEEGVAIMTGLSEKRVLEAIPVADYYAPGVSDKVVKIILGYSDFIKRRVWYQNDD